MGINCRIFLPGNVRVGDVANVLGISAGLKPRWVTTKDYRIVKVNGVQVSQIKDVAELARIELQGDLIDSTKYHYVLYHFEFRNGRLLLPPSTDFWIACGKSLVDFFGGAVDFNDCDNTPVDYKVTRKSSKNNCPEKDKDWDIFQQRLMNIKPIEQ